MSKKLYILTIKRSIRALFIEKKRFFKIDDILLIKD